MQVLVFGWGAQDHYTAQNPGIEDLLRAVVPPGRISSFR
jgi:hypothetical protein